MSWLIIAHNGMRKCEKEIRHHLLSVAGMSNYIFLKLHCIFTCSYENDSTVSTINQTIQIYPFSVYLFIINCYNCFSAWINWFKTAVFPSLIKIKKNSLHSSFECCWTYLLKHSPGIVSCCWPLSGPQLFSFSQSRTGHTTWLYGVCTCWLSSSSCRPNRIRVRSLRMRAQ